MSTCPSNAHFDSHKFWTWRLVVFPRSLQLIPSKVFVHTATLLLLRTGEDSLEFGRCEAVSFSSQKGDAGVGGFCFGKWMEGWQAGSTWKCSHQSNCWWVGSQLLLGEALCWTVQGQDSQFFFCDWCVPVFGQVVDWWLTNSCGRGRIKERSSGRRS